MKSKFIRVKNLSSWKKFSVALWPANGTRFCQAQVDITQAQKYKERNNIPWTPILLYMLSQTFKANPNFNQFIRGYRHYTREDVDLFFRITLDGAISSQESESLWGHYLRSSQDLSPLDIHQRILQYRDKCAQKENRYPEMQTLMDIMPPLLSVGAVKFLSLWIRLGLPFSTISRIAFPSVSVSNNGSISSPVAFPLLNPLTFAPVNINFGAIIQVENKTLINANIGFDHRVFDGQDLRIFLEELKKYGDSLLNKI